MKGKYFSQHFGIELNGNETWFDTRLDRDTKLYIDPFFVFKSDIPAFKGAREKFNDFFKMAVEIILSSKTNTNSMEKLEENILYFREAGEIQLGDSMTYKPGKGPGKSFSKSCINALKLLIDRGLKEENQFEKIQIFTTRLGLDGISDTTAHILKSQFIQYTREICDDLNIETSLCAVEHAEFNSIDNRWESEDVFLPENPFCPGQAILLVPKKFLCRSNAVDPDSFSSYLKRKKSRSISTDLNYALEEALGTQTIIDIAKKYPAWIDEYLIDLKNDTNIKPYDLENDERNLYRSQKEAYEFIFWSGPKLPLLSSVENNLQFDNFIEMLILTFKTSVEEEDGYKLLWNIPHEQSVGGLKPVPRKEKAIRILFFEILENYCALNSIKIRLLKESQAGKALIIFIFPSSYKNQALIEVRIAGSDSLKEGFERQTDQYLKSHKTDFGYYLIFFYSDEEKKRIEKTFNKAKNEKDVLLKGKIFTINATRPQESKAVNRLMKKDLGPQYFSLSTDSRLKLAKSLNAMPQGQFDEMVTALNPPKGILPPLMSSQSSRVSELLKWAEGSTGPGLEEVLQVLGTYIPLSNLGIALPQSGSTIFPLSTTPIISGSAASPGSVSIASPEAASPVSKEVFISYAWGGDSEEMANKVDNTLQSKGITLIRDKRDLEFKGRIKAFMEQIGQGNAVVVVISDKYLKTENCMFELVEIAANKDFCDRIFPIVLSDAQIYKPIKRIRYIQHWEQEIAELDEAMKTVNAANLQGFRESIDLYTRIRNTIADLTETLKDMNTLSPGIHTDSEFFELIGAIEDRLNNPTS